MEAPQGKDCPDPEHLRRLGEIEEAIDAIVAILALLVNPSRRVGQDFLDRTMKKVEKIIEKRR